MERKLASIRRVGQIRPIPNAEAIECASVDGWELVIKKGEFKEGDLAVYAEIDSWLPKEIAPFLFEGRTFEGVEGARLRTVRLRGQISQGLLLPMSILGDAVAFVEGDDVTEILGIKKWEKPLDPAISGLAKGNFPSFIPKTDQERVQNLRRQIQDRQGESFEVTVKLDGSSITVYSRTTLEGLEYGVCSRNLDLKEGENAFWIAAKNMNLHEKIQSTGRSLAIQMELLSPKIQGNWEKVDDICAFVYDIYDIDKRQYLLPKERRELCKELQIPHVPVIAEDFILNHTCAEILEMAEGEGMNKGVKREGLVYKSNSSDFSFKAISNSYLMKNKDA